TRDSTARVRFAPARPARCEPQVDLPVMSTGFSENLSGELPLKAERKDYLRSNFATRFCSDIRLSVGMLVESRCERNIQIYQSHVAEREGFEPPIRLPVCRISSAVNVDYRLLIAAPK